MCGGWVGLTTLPPSLIRLSIQCGILNISQLYRSPRPVTGIALLLSQLQWNLKSSDDGVQHSESLGFCTSSIVRNSKY
jgi:hypothetical protein